MIALPRRRRGNGPPSLLQDLQGPKIRIEAAPHLPDDGLPLEVDVLLDLTGSGSGADAATPLLTVSYPAFVDDVRPGMDVLLDDGTLRARRGDRGRLRARRVITAAGRGPARASTCPARR